MKLVNYKLQELVSPHLYELLGDNAWKLFNIDLLIDLDSFTSDLKRNLGCKSVFINDWLWNGTFTQSGFRETNSLTGSKYSQHKQGNAFDLKFKGITVEQAFEYLKENHKKYPFISRVEDINVTKTWLHIDGKDTQSESLYIFKP